MIKSLAVVYWGGTCGQFVRNVLANVIAETYSDLQFSRYGSAHKLNVVTQNGETFNHDITLARMESTQTHSFISIPELKSKYDRVAAITVTPGCQEEFIIRTINVLTKLNLEEQPVEIGGEYLKKNLIKHIGRDYIDFVNHVYNSRYDLDYKEIGLYFLYKDLFNDPTEYLFELEKEMDGPVDGCTILPFSIIRTGDTESFIEFVREVNEGVLSDTQREYVEKMFNRYYAAQDKVLFKTPHDYLKITQEQALGKLETFKRRFYQIPS